MKTYLFAAMIVSLSKIEMPGCPGGSLVMLTTVAPNDPSGQPEGNVPPFRDGDAYYVTAQGALDAQGQPMQDDARGFNALITSSNQDGAGVAEVGMFCDLSKNERTGANEPPAFQPGCTYRLEMELTGILDGPVQDTGTGASTPTGAPLPPPANPPQGTQPPVATGGQS